MPEWSDIRLQVSGPNGVLSLQVPLDWKYTYAEGALNTIPYAEMNNFELLPDVTPLNVQLILQTLDQLVVPVNTDAANPGLDYVRAYVADRTERGQGVYAEPVEVRDGLFRAGMVMFIEPDSVVQFGEGQHTLSLVIATYFGEEEMAILLMQGPAAERFNLLALWNYLLGTLQWNGEAVMLPELAQQLLAFESPDALVARLSAEIATPDPALAVGAPGEMVELTLNDASAEVLLPEGWSLIEQEEAAITMQPAEPEAEISASLIEMEADSPEALLAEVADLDTITSSGNFEWDTLPALAALFDPETGGGAMVIVQFPEEGGWLVLRFDLANGASPLHWTDWQQVIGQIVVNGQPLTMDTVLSVFTVLDQMNMEPTEAP